MKNYYENKDFVKSIRSSNPLLISFNTLVWTILFLVLDGCIKINYLLPILRVLDKDGGGTCKIWEWFDNDVDLNVWSDLGWCWLVELF